MRKAKIRPIRRRDLYTQEFFRNYDSRVRLLLTEDQVSKLNMLDKESRKWEIEK